MKEYNEKMLIDEINILLKTYTNEEKEDNPENNFICPLTELNLIKKVKKDLYYRNSADMDKLNMYIVYYYKGNGELDTIEKRESLQTPMRSFRYNIKGNLEEISLFLTPDNTYIFNINGELQYHWIGDKGYDKNGKVISVRY